jgi:hypothetical protein
MMTFPCIYVLYPKLLHPLNFSPFYYSPFLIVISTGLKILHSFCIESLSPIFTFYIAFFYPSLPIGALSLQWPLFHSCPLLFRFVGQWDFCLSIIPIHTLCLSQCYPQPLHFLTIFPYPVFCVLFLHRCDVFHYYPLYFLIFLLPWSPLPIPLLDICSLYISIYNIQQNINKGQKCNTKKYLNQKKAGKNKWTNKKQKANWRI